MEFQDILDSLPVAVFLLDDGLTVLYCNAALTDRIDRPAESVIGRPAHDLGLDPEQAGDWLTPARVALETGTPGEFTHRASPDSPLLTRFRFAPRPADRTLVVVVSTDRVVEPSSVELFDRVMNLVPIPAWVRDDEHRYRSVNAAYRQQAGPAVDWVGKRLHEVWPADLAGQFAATDRQVIDADLPCESLKLAPVADGSVRGWYHVKFPLTDAAGTRYAAGIAIDVTNRMKQEDDRVRHERQMFESQRLESLGLMAGGVAHDFNNLLTTILGNAGLAGMHVADPSPVGLFLKKIELAATRAAELCQQMIAYSGRGLLKMRDVDLNALVRDMTSMLGSVVPEQAEVETHLTDPVPPVRGDHGHLRQVILNLLTNASDALGDSPGVITVRTGTVTAAEVPDRHLPPGVYTYVQVADTGCGMSDEVKAKVFDPFFSTKFTGRGLGLSAVQGIVRQHKGVVHVASRVGQGSTFTVYLPAASRAGRPFRAGELWGRGRTVLVVDGQEESRQIARRVFEATGFRTVVSGTAAECLNADGDSRDRGAAVVVDESFINTPELVTLLSLNPDAKLIVTGPKKSADPDRPAAAVHHLCKPFTGDDLLRAVYEAVGP